MSISAQSPGQTDATNTVAEVDIPIVARIALRILATIVFFVFLVFSSIFTVFLAFLSIPLTLFRGTVVTIGREKYRI